MFPDEIEDLFSVFQGTTLGKEQETVGVKKYPNETQEHHEVCEGTKSERRGIQEKLEKCSKILASHVNTSLKDVHYDHQDVKE